MPLSSVREPGRDYQAPSKKHDTGYKFLLSNRATFLQFLRTFIKEDWVQDIDAEDIVRLPKSFVLQDFRHQEADLVYQLRLADKSLFFYLLMELQSTVDPMMPFRLLMYMVEIWRNYWFNENQRPRGGNIHLPAIVPCVLYNGKGEWTARTSFDQCQTGFEQFKEYALNFKYILVDVNRFDKSQLLNLGNLMSSVFYMEQLKGIDEILMGLTELAAVLDYMPEEDVRRFSTWTGKVVIKGMPQVDREKVLNHVHRKGGKSLITNFERILQETWQKYRVEGRAEGRAEGREEGRAEGRAEGREEGRAEGREEGILEGKRLTARNYLQLGIKPEQVAMASELSLNEVMKLRAELNN